MKPEDVLRGLCRSIANGDTDKFIALCNEHQTTIADHFEEWAAAASDMRDTTAEHQVVSLCLQLVAEAFAEAGRPELVDLLGRRGRAEPIH